MNLKIQNASKTYYVNKSGFEALKNVNLNFESGEFVSILGASGSGKTTLLNIIGGLDRLTRGAIIIDGKNTSDFSDKDWDAYRNRSVGFVFQNYHLIPHISVERNVEMGMALCGKSPQERKAEAKLQLEKMSITDQIGKLPSLLSGGQKQRVAIARALSNNPDIILADEPTGALDSKTSKQIMEILKEISKEKLVIMVTHNADLAKKYSTRIIKLKDGVIESDSSPKPEAKPQAMYAAKKTAMSFWQAIKLSFSNLVSKKGRTLLTSFASSIGIIGVGLVLALSNGLNLQINQFEKNILTEVPIEIASQVISFDASSNPMQNNAQNNFPTNNQIVPSNTVQSSFMKNNNLTPEFWAHMEGLNSSLSQAVRLEYGQSMNFIAKANDAYRIFETRNVRQFNMTKNMMQDKYEFLAGDFPTQTNQLFLVISKANALPSNLLAAFGIGSNSSLGFDEVLATQIKLLFNNTAYVELNGKYTYAEANESLFLAADYPLEIAGIARVKPGVDSDSLSSGLYYLPALSEIFLANSVQSNVVQAQRNSEEPIIWGMDSFSVTNTKSSLLRRLGGESSPSKIVIYPKGYIEKDAILNHIEAFNQTQNEENRIVVQDMSKMLIGTIRQFTEIISIALIVFASISLVVSSIMIGIVTYISVLERTKEIGVLRALGATKQDVSRVFNAETMLIGFFAGVIGIFTVFVLSFPGNAILGKFVPSAFGNLMVPSGTNSLFLVGLSVVLTLIAGFIPSRIASKKDPVEALRSE